MARLSLGDLYNALGTGSKLASSMHSSDSGTDSKIDGFSVAGSGCTGLAKVATASSPAKSNNFSRQAEEFGVLRLINSTRLSGLEKNSTNPDTEAGDFWHLNWYDD